MLNVVGGSKNFGADNDLKYKAIQLGKKGSRPTVFSEQSAKGWVRMVETKNLAVDVAVGWEPLPTYAFGVFVEN